MTTPTIAADASEATRLLRNAERDASCAVEDLKEARRQEAVARVNCIVAARKRLETALAALSQIVTPE